MPSGLRQNRGDKSMKYIGAISARYLALAVQFILVILVTNTLAPAQAGMYFSAFGIVTTLFCLAGLGIPDGLVRSLGDQIAAGQRDSLRRSCLFSLVFGAISMGAICLAGFSSTIYLGITAGQGTSFVGLVAVWLFVYGMVFVVAQALVALQAPALGSFFFYSATNLCILCTSVPYLTFAQAPQLTTLLKITISAACIACFAGLLTLFSQIRRATSTQDMLLGTNTPANLSLAFSIGGPIALSRMFQSMLYWIPVWVAAATLSTADSAVIGSSGRLLIAITAAIAALRFSVRPAIVAAAAQNDWLKIERIGRRICIFTTGVTLLAIFALWSTGAAVLGILLGDEYSAAWGILLILLIGALGEAFGGPVDEVLKMTGAGLVVLFGLIVTAGLQTALAFAAVPLGLTGFAGTQAFCFCLMYAAQVAYLYRIRGILIIPLPPRRESML